MWTAIIVGVSVLTTSPGVSHPTRITISNIETEEECKQTASGLVQGMRDTFRGSVRITSAGCQRGAGR